MTDVISHTEVFCPDCNTTHPAKHILSVGKIVGIVECPVGAREVVLSEHGDLFMQFRRQAHFDPAFRAPEERPFFFHYLPITDDCDCHCPVCFSAAGKSANNSYLSVEEAEDLAGTAADNGVTTVILIGGEPTLHPRLTELIGVFRRREMKVWLATNGLRIAQEPGLAVRLKEAGIEKVDLQLDSFNPTTHIAIRGHGKIGEKLTAAAAVVAAGLKLGLICTVTTHNLPELSVFCREVFSWPDLPRTVIMQGAAHSGRLTTDNTRHITREEIITSLVEGQAVPGLKAGHFWPYPLFRPLHVYVHPDCAANTFVVLHKGGIEPLANYVKTDKFLDLAYRRPYRKTTGNRRWHLMVLTVQCLRLSVLKLLLRHVADLLTGGRGVRTLFIGTGAFLREDFLDLARVRRCGSGTLTGNGCESLCAYYTCRPYNHT